MHDEPLISVIVPVYGVEKYLKRCVDSILSQTYKNIEVILVDDGSPDNCPKLCDKYETADCRVRVIHKRNGGLSSARNAGLAIATGDYVGYVDSDDWIMADMYEYLLNILEAHNADIAQINLQQKTEFDFKTKETEEEIEGFKGKDILQYYMTTTTTTGSYSVCRCLFKRGCLNNLKFREGKINEDIDFKYIALSRADSFVVSNQVKYFYFQGNEPTNSSGGLKKKDFDLYDAADELYKLTKDEIYGTIAKLGKVKKSRTAFSLLCKIAYFGIADKSINKKQIVKKLTKEHRGNVSVLLDSPMKVSRKVLAVMFAVNYKFTELCIKIAKGL